jgi:hypothetical protein
MFIGVPFSSLVVSRRYSDALKGGRIREGQEPAERITAPIAPLGATDSRPGRSALGKKKKYVIAPKPRRGEEPVDFCRPSGASTATSALAGAALLQVFVASKGARKPLLAPRAPFLLQPSRHTAKLRQCPHPLAPVYSPAISVCS